MGRVAYILAVAIFIVGCARSARLTHQLEIGMTRTQAVEILGPPAGRGLQDETEYMNYDLYEGGSFSTPYYVELKDGKVVSFGRWESTDPAK